MKKDKINEDVKKPETADTTLTETTGGIEINFWDDDNNNRDPSGQTMDPFDYGKNFPGGGGTRTSGGERADRTPAAAAGSL